MYELMEGPNLLDYLRFMGHQLEMLDLIDMSYDVAKGCKYLASRNFIHRDLKAKNCMLTSTDARSRIVKIGNFGLSRDIYSKTYYKAENNDPLPIGWMAPESIMFNKFSTESDVWSFSVLIWEIMTLGRL